MLLTGMPAVLQTAGKLGFVRPGFAAKPPRPARFGSPTHYENRPGMVPAFYEGESNLYPGSWEPFYYDSRTWWNDETLKLQAPRPGSHDWNDEALVLQAQRGPDVPYGPQGVDGLGLAFGEGGGENVLDFSTGTKVAFAIGVSALLIGGAALVVKHTLMRNGF